MESEKIRDINDYNALYGYKDFKVYQLDDEMLSAVHDIYDLDIPEFNGITIPYIRKRAFFKKTINFFASKLSFHDVGFMSDKMLKRLINKNEISSIDQLVELYNSSGAMVSPYKIPIEFTRTKAFSGTLETQLVLLDDHEQFIELLSKLNIYFNEIFLPKKTTNVSVGCYAHELIHLQLLSQKGIVESLYDSEVFSIFFELLCAYENHDVYLYVLVLRINMLFSSINNMFLYQTDQKDKIEASRYELYEFCMSGKYLLSTLKAFSLLDKYLNGSYSTKRSILLRMQSVIDGEQKMSEFLEHYDVGYETIKDSSITDRLLRL